MPDDTPERAAAVMRGAATEQRVLDVLLAGIAAATLPRWLLSVRRGSRREDQVGIDLVVTCDDGEHAIQVKSSIAGLRHFVADRAAHADGLPRGVVVIGHEMSDRRLRGQVVSTLNTLRLQRRMATEAAP